MRNIFRLFNDKSSNDSQSVFNKWIDGIIEKEHPDSDIIAYNIGIFESTKGYQLYFAGFKKFDANNDDWAVGIGDFCPINNYLSIKTSDFKSKKWEDIQNVTVDLIKNYMLTDSYKNSFLANAVAITTGFDDGELVKIKNKEITATNIG